MWLKRYHLKIFLFFRKAELSIRINFGRRHYEDHYFEIILNLDQLFRRRGHLKIILIYSLFVQCFQTICGIMVDFFGSGPYGEHFCETVLNMEQWFKRKLNMEQ